MRIWDINPGYLNRQSLLGEHRELHGIVSIICNNKKGYSSHPETRRWAEYGWALKMRHRLLSCEMALRGYTDRSPVNTHSSHNAWPATYIDTPGDQFALLKEKYRDREPGRIALPANTQQLWSHHKYSVLARNPVKYKKLGQDIAGSKRCFEDLAQLLTELLRTEPSAGGIRNAVQHMWGHISKSISPREKPEVASWTTVRLLKKTQAKAVAAAEPFLLNSTALSELACWLDS